MTDTDRHLAAIVEQLKALNHNLQQAFPPLLPMEPQPCEHLDRDFVTFGSDRWKCRTCGVEGGE